MESLTYTSQKGAAHMTDMTVPKAPVIFWHKRLVAADRTYANSRTPANHHKIIHAQRVYYALLSQYVRNYYPPDISIVKRADAIMKRALLNRKREKANPEWQDIALHQYRRAIIVHRRAYALAETIPTWPINAPPPAKRVLKVQSPKVRVIHPVTGRYVYVDRTD